MNACEPASGTTGGLRLGRKDGLFTLETRLFLPRPLEIVFPFFADAGNLETITPPWLRFEILTPRPIAMRAGALIEYRLRLHGIPVRWQSDKYRRGGGTVTSIPLGYRTPLSMIAPV
jgi:hypothetical protein